jgi:hypothetical protein
LRIEMIRFTQERNVTPCQLLSHAEAWCTSRCQEERLHSIFQRRALHLQISPSG